MIYNHHDVVIGKSLEIYGEYCQGEVDLFRQVIKKGDLVLDIGANIGAHTLFFAKKVGLKGEVHAFEPQRIIFQTLCGNMALNSMVKTHCYNMALGNTNGFLRIPQITPWMNFNFGGVSVEGHVQGDPIPLATIDSFEFTRCHFIKIDVEGMEKKVLMGARETIRQHRPFLYVENDREEKSEALITYLKSLDYNLFWHLTSYFNPNNFDKNSENIFSHIVAKNMFCVPRESELKIEGLKAI